MKRWNAFGKRLLFTLLIPVLGAYIFISFLLSIPYWVITGKTMEHGIFGNGFHRWCEKLADEVNYFDE